MSFRDLSYDVRPRLAGRQISNKDPWANVQRGRTSRLHPIRYKISHGSTHQGLGRRVCQALLLWGALTQLEASITSGPKAGPLFGFRRRFRFRFRFRSLSAGGKCLLIGTAGKHVPVQLGSVQVPPAERPRLCPNSRAAASAWSLEKQKDVLCC